jgi:TP901 family phage tail tape measure protein
VADKTLSNLAVRVSMDSSGFQQGVSGINKQLSVVKSEFKAASAELGGFGNSTEQLRLKSNSLNQQIELQKQKVAALKQAFQESAEKKGADAKATQELQIKLNGARTALANMETDLSKTNKSLEESIKKEEALTKETGKLGLSMKSLKDDFAKAQQEAANLKVSFDSFKVAGAGLTAAGAGIAVGLGGAVRSAMDFDAQMSKVQALSGSTAEQFEQLKEKAIELGAATSFSSSQAAEGMQMLAAAGMDANKIMEAMPGVLSAAAASGEEMALVAETMGTALNTFGLEASESAHVADILAQVANKSSAGVQDMAYSMKYVGPVAAQLGVSLEEVGTTVIEMANAGIKGEQAGTTMRSALLRLIDPPKDAGTALDMLGISITDSSGKMKPLSDIIGELNEGLAGQTEAQKAATLSTIFGTEAVSGMMVLVGNGKKTYDEYTKALQESNGEAKKAADVMQNNLKGSMDQLTGSLESAGISIGEALTPAIKAVASAITGMVNLFNVLPGPVKNMIAIFAALVAGMLLIGGPALMLIGFLPQIAAGFAQVSTVMGLLTGGLGPLKTGIGLVSGVLRTGLAGALTFIMSPVGIAIAAIVVLAGLAFLVIKNWEPIKEFFSGLWDGVSKGFTAAKAAIVQTAGNLVVEAKEKINGLWTWIQGIPAQAPQWGKNIIKGIIDGIKSIHIPLPHFSVTMGSWEVAGVTVPKPAFDIDWYGSGGIFTSPAIIGVGERGTEAVLPLDKISSLFDYDKLASAVTKNGKGDVINLYFTGTVRNDNDAKRIAQELDNLIYSRRRGQAVTA